MPDAWRDFYAGPSLQRHIAVVGPHDCRSFQHVEELPSMHVGVPLFLAASGNPLLDHREIIPIEQAPAIADLPPTRSARRWWC